MKVSVIIPTYNEEKVIGKCLRSLLNQSYEDYEILIVDDGSNDKTIEIVGELAANHQSLVNLVQQKHLGPGEARNLGAKKAKGKILVFVDADMTFDQEFLEYLVKPIQEGKTKGTFGKEEYVSNWDNIWARCWNINQGWEKERRHPKNYPDTQKVFRAILKKEFDAVGGFEKGGHYTDDYLSDRLGYEASVARGAIFYHENPDNLHEVFTQARWAAKRKYKLGIVGVLWALLRSSLPFSAFVGLYKSIKHSQLSFLVFKIAYDFGVFVGLSEYVIFGKKGK